jgi:hypothetical protein
MLPSAGRSARPEIKMVGCALYVRPPGQALSWATHPILKRTEVVAGLPGDYLRFADLKAKSLQQQRSWMDFGVGNYCSQILAFVSGALHLRPAKRAKYNAQPAQE